MDGEGYLDIEKQVKLLRNKGIEVSGKSTNILKKVNYYTLMSYKNIFYTEGIEHKYKNNIKIDYLYKMYKYDWELKKIILFSFQELKSIITNKIVSIFEGNNISYKENGYLNKKIYNDFLINKMYLNIIQNNLDVKKYYELHGFLPIWILINYLNFKCFMEYLCDFKKKYFSQIVENLYIEDIEFIIKIFDCIINGKKIYNFSFNDKNINTLLKIFRLYNIDTSKIIKIYKKMYKNIPVISIADVVRESKINIGELYEK